MLRFYPAAELVLLLAAFADQAPQPYRVSVNVDLVVLNPTVQDRKGQCVWDLREENFEVYEDGIRQRIRLFRHEDVPVTVGLVIDHSGSMRRKISEVIAAARTFVRLSNPDDQMFVVNFNERVTLGLPSTISFTRRIDDLEYVILRPPETGQTALYDAIVEAEQRVATGSREKKVLIVVSDCGDNASKFELAEVLRKAEQSTAVVNTIPVFKNDDPDANPRVLKRLAQVTGGESFLSGERDALVANCERIARDIRQAYTIGYAPAGGVRPGVYRSIRVVARAEGGGKFAVRARDGYIAGEPAK
jgi:Ca-activated chloride channel homolog